MDGWIMTVCSNSRLPLTVCCNEHSTPGLQASTILEQRTASGAFCSICRESDHSSQQCALSYLHQTTPQSQPSSQHPQVRLTSTNDPQRARRPMQIRRRPESLLQMCLLEQGALCVPRYLHIQTYLCYMSSRPQGKRMPRHPRGVRVQA